MKFQMNIGEHYFKDELKLTKDQQDKAYKWFQKHQILSDTETFTPTTIFSIEYEFTGIGVAKFLVIGDKRFWINEEECENP